MMNCRSVLGAAVVACLTLSTAVASAQSTRLVSVEPNVKLEVIDWGGTGRPVVLLAGLGATAHAFAGFAPLLTATYHVVGITRRGFGASSVPTDGYSADRLGDDVLAVVDSLRLERPVLAGHSLAGEELSSIGSRHPEKVAGLVYLDAAYPYAFYDRDRGDFRVDLDEARRHLAQLDLLSGPDQARSLLEQLLTVDMPALDRALRQRLAQLPPTPHDASARSTEGGPAFSPPSPVLRAIMEGEQRYTEIRVPVLAIFALPHRMPAEVAADPVRRKIWSDGQAGWPAQADAFERGVPTARVVRIPNADHAVFDSNPSDVVRQMHAFISGLPDVPPRVERSGRHVAPGRPS